MPIQFYCDTCRRPVAVPEGSEGAKTRCPTCYSILRVPYANTPASMAPRHLVREADPLGIDDDASPDDSDLPDAAVLVEDDPFSFEPPAAPPSADLLNEKSRRVLRRTSSLLLLTSIVSMMMPLIGITMAAMLMLEGNVQVSVWEITILTILALLHVPTIIGLFEARALRSYQWACIGLGLSLFPLTHLAVMLVFPAIISFWALSHLTRPEGPGLFSR